MKKILPLFLFVSLPLSAVQVIETTELTSGDANCPLGGIYVAVGDPGADDILDDSEIQSGGYVCNGADGCNAKSEPGTPAEIYAACPTGGVMIKSGFDCNLDDKIDTDKQIIKTSICNVGTTPGDDGESKVSMEIGNGKNGADGADGKASEFVVSEEPAGEKCAEGGSKIEICFDADGNGTFEESEITVKYICNGSAADKVGPQGDKGKTNIGTDGKNGAEGSKGDRGDQGEPGLQGHDGAQGEAGTDGFDSLVSIVDEPAGSKCENGGKKFMNGLDKDRNGVLDENEVQNSYYICNGDDAPEASETMTSSGCSLTVL